MVMAQFGIVNIRIDSPFEDFWIMARFGGVPARRTCKVDICRMLELIPPGLEEYMYKLLGLTKESWNMSQIENQ